MVTEVVLAKARQRSYVGDSGVIKVLKLNDARTVSPCHVIIGHVDVRDVDDVTHCWRHEYQLGFIDSLTQKQQQQQHVNTFVACFLLQPQPLFQQSFPDIII